MIIDYNETREGLALRAWIHEIRKAVNNIQDDNAVSIGEAFDIFESDLYNSIDCYFKGKPGSWIESCQNGTLDGSRLLGCAIESTGIVGPITTSERNEMFGPDRNYMIDMFVPAYIAVLSSYNYSSGLLRLLNCVRI